LPDEIQCEACRNGINYIFESVEKLAIEEQIHSGVKEDEIITLTVKDGDNISKLNLRKIRF